MLCCLAGSLISSPVTRASSLHSNQQSYNKLIILRSFLPYRFNRARVRRVLDLFGPKQVVMRAKHSPTSDLADQWVTTGCLPKTRLVTSSALFASVTSRIHWVHIIYLCGCVKGVPNQQDSGPKKGASPAPCIHKQIRILMMEESINFLPFLMWLRWCKPFVHPYDGGTSP